MPLALLEAYAALRVPGAVGMFAVEKKRSRATGGWVAWRHWDVLRPSQGKKTNAAFFEVPRRDVPGFAGYVFPCGPWVNMC